MARISLIEQYNNRDVIAQIYRMMDLVNKGTYASIDVQADGNGNYVFTFTDQEGTAQTFTLAAKQVSSITSNQSGSTVTLTITYNDGSTDTLSLTGIVTEATNQTITGTKVMSSTSNDIRVLTTPAATTAAVNQAYVESTVDGVNGIVHKSGDETISGTKTFQNQPTAQMVSYPIFSSSTETTFIQLFPSGAANKQAIFYVTDALGSGQAIVRLGGTSGNVLSFDKNVLLGNINSTIGMVEIDGYFYLYVNGAVCISDLYLRYGGGQRREAVLLGADEQIDVSDTTAYPTRIEVVW